jgi:hypothetical protein
MASDTGPHINERSLELFQFFEALLCDNAFEHGGALMQVHECMEMPKQLSLRLVKAAMDRAAWEADHAERKVQAEPEPEPEPELAPEPAASTGHASEEEERPPWQKTSI